MTVEVSQLSLLDGTMGGIAATAGGGRPLVVFVHGGASDSSETLRPGHSQLLLAAANGYSAFALDRPGYGASVGLGFPADSDDGVFAANARQIDAAIAELWMLYGNHSAGVVVWGCSMGGAIALHLASQWSQNMDSGWPLLGVIAADIGHIQTTEFVANVRSAPFDDPLDLTPLLSASPQPPAWTRLSDESGRTASIPLIPRSEVMEVVGGWPRDWRSVVSKIRVPVMYRIGEYDQLWVVSDEIVGTFADALRVSSPYVDAAIVRGGSHALLGSVVADEFNFTALGFVARCGAANQVPELLVPQDDAAIV